MAAGVFIAVEIFQIPALMVEPMVYVIHQPMGVMVEGMVVVAVAVVEGVEIKSIFQLC
jgi:hypothetical protein